MKKLHLLIMCFTVINLLNAQSKTIGHRSPSNVPILDITTTTLNAQVSSNLNSNGFNLLSINNLEINDNPINQNYNKNLTMEVMFTDVAGTQYTGYYYFVLSYDGILNKYYLDQTGGPLQIQAGGKPICSKINCIGCKPYKGTEGQPGGCSDCNAKVDTSSPNGPDCLESESNGNGPAWVTAIGSLLDVLINLLK